MRSSALDCLRRLPATTVRLIALYALLRMEGNSAAIPIWAALIVIATVVPSRLPKNAAVLWLLRILAFGCVIYTIRARTIDMINMFDMATMTWVGELLAAELTLSTWTASADDPVPARSLFLSGIILLAASSVRDDEQMFVIAPAYFFAVLVTLRYGARTSTARPRQHSVVSWQYCLAVALALAGGAASSALLTAQRSAIYMLGVRFLGDHASNEGPALSISPILTSTFGQRGSMTRALRIEGEGDFSHLRGIAYTIYSRGMWAPRISDHDQQEINPSDLDAPQSRRIVSVTRLLHNYGILFAPLNSQGLRFSRGTAVYRFAANGGMLRTIDTVPAQYQIALSSSEEHQGPLCAPPTAAERRQLLDVPRDIEPGVRMLSKTITGGIAQPRRRIELIEQYLISHHHYSLTVDIGAGDPVSNFLLKRKSAHCEYFASAAVILSRLAGVPARYVIGYLAHERDGPDAVAVRQRDAHAWAECWLPDVGWVVLDATPGDGRPDALTDRPSVIARWMERIQDTLTAIRAAANGLGVVRLMCVVFGIAVVFTAVRAILSLQILRHRAGAKDEYETRDAQLAALHGEFVRFMRRLGLVCPMGVTWAEFLAANKDSGTSMAPAREQFDSAAEFIAEYNAARFGGRGSGGDMERLRSLLTRISVKQPSQISEIGEARTG